MGNPNLGDEAGNLRFAERVVELVVVLDLGPQLLRPRRRLPRLL